MILRLPIVAFTLTLLVPLASARGTLTETDLIAVVERLAREAFQKLDKQLDRFYGYSNPETVVLFNQGRPENYYCVCASMINSAHENYDNNSPFHENAKHHQFGCFLVGQSKPPRLIVLGFFPTRRWLDYVAFCVGASKDNVVTIGAKDDNYGDQEQKRHYKVNLSSGKAEEFSVEEIEGPFESIH